MLTTLIEVKTQFEGFHSWPDAPEEVAFLRSKHRHIFYVCCQFKVSHLDRDLEFFIVKRVIDRILRPVINLSWSCEMWASELYYQLSKQNFPVVRVSVHEDDENGAIVCE